MWHQINWNHASLHLTWQSWLTYILQQQKRPMHNIEKQLLYLMAIIGSILYNLFSRKTHLVDRFIFKRFFSGKQRQDIFQLSKTFSTGQHTHSDSYECLHFRSTIIFYKFCDPKIATEYGPQFLFKSSKCATTWDIIISLKLKTTIQTSSKRKKISTLKFCYKLNTIA